MSSSEWTVLEKLLLSQAVYKYGEDNWFQIARNLKHHALLDRPSDYFNQKNCSLQYYLMIEDLDKEKKQHTSLSQDMPPVVQLARHLYTLRLEELKKALAEDEEKFMALVSEIDDIRAGKWDDELTKNMPPQKQGNMTLSPSEDKLEEADSKQPNQDATLPEPAALVQHGEETKMMEEEAKVEADNLENEARDIQTEDAAPPSSDDSFRSAAEVSMVLAEQEQQPSEEQQKQEEHMQAEEKEEQMQQQENGEKAEQMQEEEKAEEKQKEPEEEQAVEDQTQDNKKRLIDEVIEQEEQEENQEPEAKRPKTEDTSSLSLPLSSEKATEDAEMLDISRQDYSTDVSQGTTPADTTDLNLQEGTESVAESESNAPTPNTERRKVYNRDDQRHKSWLKNINLLWREIANHKNGTMFMNPIKENIAPHYYDIVKRPMDLKTIKNKIRDGLINTTEEFERDVMLMINNSLMYNKEGTEVYQMAREMLDDAVQQITTFKAADADTSTSSHTRAAAKERRKSVAPNES